MSEKDRFDWSDDTDFDSLADEPIEGFADFEDMNGYEDSLADDPADDADALADRAETAASESVAATSDDPVDTKKRKLKASAHGRRGISSGELGFLFSASILVAAAGIGSASLLAVGVNPASLWQPAEFMAWENYLNLQNSPLNILALICLGVVFLTLLGSRAVAKAANVANERAAVAEEMLDRVTSLRLEDEGSWQDPAFKAFAPAASFVAETLGAWRLQAARQKHFTGLEGELHRLERALAENSRADLTGRFDSPAVGALSDEMIRYFDERETLSRELAEHTSKEGAESAEILQVLQDARCWQKSSTETLGLQGTAVDRLSERLKGAAAAMAPVADEDGPQTVLDAFKAELDNLRTAEAKAPDAMVELTNLVDKGGKLAFQIAMEVARLGPRGERLVPMSQALEDLTTSFRTVADDVSNGGRQGNDLADGLARLAVKLTDLDQKIQSDDGGNWQGQLQELGAGAEQLARNLSEIVQSHEPQAARLVTLGTNFSEFSGGSFDADDLTSGNSENPPAGVLSIEGQTPFGDGGHDGESIHQPADVDPFSVTPPSRVDNEPSDSTFTSSVGTPEASIFGNDASAEKMPGLEIDSSFGSTQDPFDTGAAAEEEKVYDLDDFGSLPATDETEAVEATEPPVAAEEEIYELSDFSAQPVIEEEQVYEIADLGAVSLDSPVAEVDEEIFDLNDFGAVKLS